MIRGLLGLILGLVFFTAAAVFVGKQRDMSAADFEPILVVAMVAGAVIGLGLGVWRHRSKQLKAGRG